MLADPVDAGEACRAGGGQIRAAFSEPESRALP